MTETNKPGDPARREPGLMFRAEMLFSGELQ